LKYTNSLMGRSINTPIITPIIMPIIKKMNLTLK